MAKKKTEEVENVIEDIASTVEDQAVEVDKLEELVEELVETEEEYIGTIILPEAEEPSIEEPTVVAPKVSVKCECGGVAITVRNRTGSVKVCKDCGLVK